MALLRIVCFPSTSQLSDHYQQLFCPCPASSSLLSLHKPPLPLPTSIILSPPPSLSSSISPLSHTLPIKNQRPNLFLLHFSSSTQSQPTIKTPEELEESESLEEEEDEGSRTRLLAQNVPWTCTPDEIRPLFEKHGTVVDIELSMYNKTRNRGLAFVTMGSHEEALAALKNLESHEYDGRDLKLTWAKPRKKKPSSSPVQPKPAPIHNLFVANLPFQARAKDLKEFFNAEDANVVSAEIIFHDNPRRSAGYGFVSFNTKKEAEAALSAFQGKMFMERPIQVERSRRFLRQETKLNTQSEVNSSELNPDAEQSEKAEG